MLTMRFGPADLANVRFAISPLFELWQSVRALQNPATRALHLHWLADTRDQVTDLDLSVLYALQTPTGYSPDFIHPPPTGPLAELDDELEQVLSTPTERISFELTQICADRPMPEALQPFLDQPEAALEDLARLLRAYWERALAPHWERVRAALEGDILHRAHESADNNAQTLFSDFDSTVRYADAQLLIDKPWERTIDLDGRGLLLVPSVFVWPGLVVIDEPPWQPSLIYAARGAALLWEPAPSAPMGLSALIGRRRAAILASLDAPRCTAELAHRLKLTPGGVSQHLSVLLGAGLVSRQRAGRVVLYCRTPSGEMLANGHSADV
jgi:hypothetical protein